MRVYVCVCVYVCLCVYVCECVTHMHTSILLQVTHSVTLQGTVHQGHLNSGALLIRVIKNRSQICICVYMYIRNHVHWDTCEGHCSVTLQRTATIRSSATYVLNML